MQKQLKADLKAGKSLKTISAEEVEQLNHGAVKKYYNFSNI